MKKVNQNSDTGTVSIVVATPILGNREFRFQNGKALSSWVWYNRSDIFASVPKDQQTE